MKTKIRGAFVVLAALSVLMFSSQLSTCLAQGTAFTYQGRLNVNGTPASGLYDFRFKLYVDPLGNTQIGGSYATNAIPATNGLFTAPVDFGSGIFTGSNYWLEVDVRTNNTVTYSVLTPLQPVTPTPYSIFANTASNLSGTLPAAQINGPVQSANISGTYGNALTLNNSGNSFVGSYTGNGANLTNVNAAALNGLNATNFWQVGGNNVSAGQFIGSTNNQPVEIHVGGVRAMRLELNPEQVNDSNIVNIVNGSPANFVTPGIIGATIGGGGASKHSSFNSTNSVTWHFGTVSGGVGNSSGGLASTVAGGQANNAGGSYSVIAGGQANLSPGSWGSVGGGFGNTAGNQGATVPGGYDNTANGLNSFAAGYYAQAQHDGAFVWADDSQFAPFASTGTNQFLIRSLGGVGIDTATPVESSLSINTNTYLYSHPMYLRGEGGVDHNHALAYNGNLVTNFGTGNYQVDGPALWGFAGGLLGTRNGVDHAALTWNTTGVTVNGTLGGNGSGLTNLNAAQLSSGAVPLARLPSAVLTNGETRSVTFNGTLFFPDQNVQAISGLYSFWHSDTGGNFSIGYDAGDYLSSSGGGGNTAVGYQAMTFTTTGTWNTALGGSALFLAGIGTGNTAIGGNALAQLGGFGGAAGGTNNIALGYEAGFNFTTNESYNIDIGNPGVAGENNTTRIGTPGTQTTAYIAGLVNDVGGVQVGSSGTAVSVIQSGQVIVPGSSTQETNYTIAFPHPFSSSPKIIFTLANDPGFQGVSDIFASSVSSNSPSAFSINVYRLNGTSWSQQLRVNWQAWQ